MDLIYKFRESACSIPADIEAGYTLRAGGYSKGKYAGFNLGDHVDDDPLDVAHNRKLLEDTIDTKIVWMKQTHSNSVVFIDKFQKQPVLADGLITNQAHIAIAVMTADCLPLLLFSSDSKVISCVHCGWRGLHEKIVANALSIMRIYTQAPINAILGPCIGPNSYEVGADFLVNFPDKRESCFKKTKNNKYLCDLTKICSLDLQALGVNKIFSCQKDTFGDNENFYSYRRNPITGRMASFILKK